MPIVPFTRPSASGPASSPLPEEPCVLMAAAQMQNEMGGDFIGELTDSDDLSWERTEAIGKRNDKGSVERIEDVDKLKQLLRRDEEGYTLPDNPFLWIRKKKPGTPKPEDLVS